MRHLLPGDLGNRVSARIGSGLGATMMCCDRIVHLMRLDTVEIGGRHYAHTADVAAALELHYARCPGTGRRYGPHATGAAG